MTTKLKPTLRRDLPKMTPRISKLPLNERGYPVPFFVAYVDGKPDFRIIDPRKLVACVRERLFWICGGKLGRAFAFLAGPMCGVNRISAEPPSHCDCAEWAVQACPFMVKPQMVRREDDLSRANAENVAGVAIKRNPGVTMLWVTRSYALQPDGAGRFLFRIGPPNTVHWWREGRAATRAEVTESISTGLPLLQELDANLPGAERVIAAEALHKATFNLLVWLPSQ